MMHEYVQPGDPAYQAAETYPPGFVLGQYLRGQPDPIPAMENPWPLPWYLDRLPVGVSGWVAYPVRADAP